MDRPSLLLSHDQCFCTHIVFSVYVDIMKGYNGTIFVYGQTSSGKTHTMQVRLYCEHYSLKLPFTVYVSTGIHLIHCECIFQGPSIDDPELRGIIPRMNGTIFEAVMNADPSIEFLVKASYIEIYMEKIKDLLDGKSLAVNVADQLMRNDYFHSCIDVLLVSKPFLQVREDKTKGIWVEGATEVYVSSEQDVLEIIRTGSQNRAIAETKMNFESSRSHSIFILTVQQKNLNDGSLKAGKLYLVDLAGSEKVEKTGATGTTLDEAKMINKSLSSLGNVINALTDGKVCNVQSSS
jgi:kinesin family protein 5